MPLLSVGFRLFFLLGTAHAVCAMAIWAGLLGQFWAPGTSGLAATVWHGHEMIYGFSVAVIAGFLLTAVQNWTKQSTLTGWPLALLGVTWLVPRVLLPFGGPQTLMVAALFDVLFAVGLLAAVARPVVLARQARQAGIVSKIALLAVGQGVFYAGALGWLAGGEVWGLGIGLYMVLALMITVAGRVVVFFIQSVLPDAQLRRTGPRFDRAALLAFLALFVLDVFTPWETAISAVALLLAVLHTIRLWGWFTPAVVGRPLLWVLHLAYAWIIVGFVLQGLTPWLGLSPALALHAYAAGGIGTLTLGMMARVSLGHTGRDLRTVRPYLGVLFALVVAAGGVRVLGPWVAPTQAPTMWLIAAALWILAFGGLGLWALPLWVLPRPDGR